MLGTETEERHITNAFICLHTMLTVGERTQPLGPLTSRYAILEDAATRQIAVRSRRSIWAWASFFLSDAFLNLDAADALATRWLSVCWRAVRIAAEDGFRCLESAEFLVAFWLAEARDHRIRRIHSSLTTDGTKCNTCTSLQLALLMMTCREELTADDRSIMPMLEKWAVDISHFAFTRLRIQTLGAGTPWMAIDHELNVVSLFVCFAESICTGDLVLASHYDMPSLKTGLNIYATLVCSPFNTIHHRGVAQSCTLYFHCFTLHRESVRLLGPIIKAGLYVAFLRSHRD
jgi:hypothetical protein